MFEDLIPELRGYAQELVYAAGISGLQARVTSTRRSHLAQARLYRRYRAGLSPLPAAPPGQSAHEYGYAFDLVVSPWEALQDVGYTWEQWGGIWGGARDPVHFEYPGFSPHPYYIQEIVGQSLGRATTDVFQPSVGSIPGVIPAIKLGTADPYTLASSAAQLYLWLSNP